MKARSFFPLNVLCTQAIRIRQHTSGQAREGTTDNGSSIPAIIMSLALRTYILFLVEVSKRELLVGLLRTKSLFEV